MAWVRAAATLTCWPSTARKAISAGSTHAGDAPPGRGLNELAQERVGAERGVDGERVGVEVQQVAAARGGLGLVARVAGLQAGDRAAVREVHGDHRRTVRQAQAAPVGRALDLLDAPDGAQREEAEQRPGVERKGAVELHAPIQRLGRSNVRRAGPQRLRIGA